MSTARDAKNASKTSGRAAQGRQERSGRTDTTGHRDVAGPRAAASPFLTESGLTVELSGDWTVGGVLELYLDGERRECLELPAAQWAVMANLLLAAIRSQSTYWFNSHVPTDKLASSLEAQDVLEMVLPEKIYKLVLKIRSRLAKTGIRSETADSELSGKQWARQLIRSRKGTGYRIALPPKNLRLFIGETEYHVKDGSGPSADPPTGI